MKDSKMPSADKIEIIEPDAIIPIKISTSFYRRVQMAVMTLVESKSEEELTAAFEQIKSNNITEAWVETYETLLILCKEFETTAVSLGKTKFITKEELETMIKNEETESSPSDSQSDD
jgi:putative transposon-encoded protein